MKKLKEIEDFMVSESFAQVDQHIIDYTQSLAAADAALDKFLSDNTKNAIMADIQKTAKDLKAEIKKLQDKSKAAGIWSSK